MPDTEFTIDHPYGHQTRDGRKVRILCTDAKGRHPIVGLIDDETPDSWEKDGSFDSECDPGHPLDLINSPAPRKTVWVNMAVDGNNNTILEAWGIKENADRNPLLASNKNSATGREFTRFACVEIEVPAVGTGLGEGR